MRKFMREKEGGRDRWRRGGESRRVSDGMVVE